MSHRLFMIAGEQSGDARAAGVATALFDQDSSLQIRGAGGRKMDEAGVELVRDLAREGVVGLWEVIGKLNYFAESYRQILSEIRQYDPHAVVLVDFPGFNLKLARQLKKEGFRIIYYISPQVWAWRKYRIRTIREVVDLMIVLFQFEREMYQENNVPVEWVGHPLVDEIQPPSESETPAALREEFNLDADDTVLGVLPGSRAKEFRRHYPRMRKAVEHVRTTQQVDRLFVPIASELNRSRVESFAPSSSSDVEQWLDGRAREVIDASDVILTASGTTTLEAALLETPMVVCYRLNPITWAIGRALVQTDHVAMVNIVAGDRVVPECIQWQATAERLAKETRRLLDPDHREACRDRLSDVRERLGPPGASRRAAEVIRRFLSET